MASRRVSCGFWTNPLVSILSCLGNWNVNGGSWCSSKKECVARDSSYMSPPVLIRCALVCCCSFQIRDSLRNIKTLQDQYAIAVCCKTRTNMFTFCDMLAHYFQYYLLGNVLLLLSTSMLHWTLRTHNTFTIKSPRPTTSCLRFKTSVKKASGCSISMFVNCAYKSRQSAGTCYRRTKWWLWIDPRTIWTGKKWRASRYAFISCDWVCVSIALCALICMHALSTCSVLAFRWQTSVGKPNKTRRVAYKPRRKYKHKISFKRPRLVVKMSFNCTISGLKRSAK